MFFLTLSDLHSWKCASPFRAPDFCTVKPESSFESYAISRNPLTILQSNHQSSSSFSKKNGIPVEHLKLVNDSVSSIQLCNLCTTDLSKTKNNGKCPWLFWLETNFGDHNNHNKMKYPFDALSCTACLQMRTSSMSLWYQFSFWVILLTKISVFYSAREMWYQRNYDPQKHKERRTLWSSDTPLCCAQSYLCVLSCTFVII